MNGPRRVTLPSMEHHTRTEASQDAQAAARLVPLWLCEAAENEPRTAEAARRAWEDDGRVLPEDAQELADWATARVTRTGFNQDEGPSRPGPLITVGDKEALHRWLRAQGHPV